MDSAAKERMRRFFFSKKKLSSQKNACGRSIELGIKLVWPYCQVNNAGRFVAEDGSISKPASLLPALDAQYALSVRSPYILVHELLDKLVKNKGMIQNSLPHGIHVHIQYKKARWEIGKSRMPTYSLM